MEQVSQQKAIPKLDLEDFRFSPPGSMGWSYAEYEKIIDSGQAELEVDTTSSLKTPPVPTTDLKELPPGNGTIIEIPKSSIGSTESLGETEASEVEGNPISLQEDLSESVQELVLDQASIDVPSYDDHDEHIEQEENEYSLLVRKVSRPRALGKSNFGCPVLSPKELFKQKFECNETEPVQLEDESEEVEETIQEPIEECILEEAPGELVEQPENEESSEEDCEEEEELESSEEEDRAAEYDCDDDGLVQIIDTPKKRSSIWLPAGNKKIG
ncbi:hypothetical protein [Guptibacillus algicola]|uniref:hypothetical protein n=1 Tax=Guptibacillus algicola TaxID=225844 RepID=UPI001CD222BC|nr:hypothetical protein [Alkalihalobacillus algicola]MCA0987843.1 hypothetical protein [Alkalihalobacillus algicola]